MAITYGTLLGIVIFPVIIFNTFLDNTNGSLWLRSIETKESIEQGEKFRSKKYYPTFLNILIQTGKNLSNKEPKETKNESALSSSNILDYQIGRNYLHDFIHYHKKSRSVNFVYYDEITKRILVKNTMKKIKSQNTERENMFTRVWSKLSGA